MEVNFKEYSDLKFRMKAVKAKSGKSSFQNRVVNLWNGLTEDMTNGNLFHPLRKKLHQNTDDQDILFALYIKWK